MEHYCDANDYNKVFCYSNGSDFDDVTEYYFLVRCLSKQIVVKEFACRLRPKEDCGFRFGMLQNPSDPEAIFREKAGKEYQGYISNIEETVNKNDSVVMDYQFEQSTYSDSRFYKDSMKR